MLLLTAYHRLFARVQGQAHHFVRYAPESIPYAIKRYQEESRRLYGVMERALSDGREYLAGIFLVRFRMAERRLIVST